MHKQIFEKRHNFVRKERIKTSSLPVRLHIMVDNPIRFQDHPLKTVGEVVFTRICYVCI